MGKVTIPEIKKILYATDLSENAGYAFRYAVSISHHHGAGITILYVLEAPRMGVYYIGDQWKEIKERNVEEVITEVKTRLAKFRDDMSGDLASHPFNVDDIRVRVGNPVEQILLEAEEGNFDVLVMGTHGHGVLEDTMMGSTARRVLRRSRKPVLVVRLPKGEH